ncbi:MAG TPA: hypothetical protein PLV58_08170, partial [Campylobacterales bacterium]|nr:hypothetical protein [Campylobacterales bacterium]
MGDLFYCWFIIRRLAGDEPFFLLVFKRRGQIRAGISTREAKPMQDFDILNPLIKYEIPRAASRESRLLKTSFWALP